MLKAEAGGRQMRGRPSLDCVDGGKCGVWSQRNVGGGSMTVHPKDSMEWRAKVHL